MPMFDYFLISHRKEQNLDNLNYDSEKYMYMLMTPPPPRFFKKHKEYCYSICPSINPSVCYAISYLTAR